MNDTMAAAIFLEYSRREARLARSGWMRSRRSHRATLRARIAGLLLAFAAHLAPSPIGTPQATQATQGA